MEFSSCSGGATLRPDLCRKLSQFCLPEPCEALRQVFPKNASKIAMPDRPLCSSCLESSMQTLRNLAAAALLLLVPAAWAQSAWPSAPVKLIVPFGVASTPDTVARLVADRLSARIG